MGKALYKTDKSGMKVKDLFKDGTQSLGGTTAYGTSVEWITMTLVYHQLAFSDSTSTRPARYFNAESTFQKSGTIERYVIKPFLMGSRCQNHGARAEN